MTSSVGYSKGAIKIQCKTSLFPAPRPQGSWPIPNFPGTESSLLALTLVAVANQSASGIQVASAGVLPSTSAAWTLFHRYYQGTAPSPLPAPDTIPITLDNTGKFTITLSSPMAGATHLFWLQSVDGSKTTTYPVGQLTTPVDPLYTVNALTVADQLAVVLQWQQTQALQFGYPSGTLGSPAVGSLDSDAAILSISHTAYDNAIAALSTGLIAAGAPANWATTWPSSATLTAVGIKTNLATWWANIATAQKSLQALCAAGPGGSPDFLTNAGKIVLMAWWNTEKTMQTSLDLQAQGMTPPVDHSAYDSAIGLMSTNLIGAGAPANWATTWPDGTTLNHTGILASIATWEAAIGVQRNALLTAIAQGQSNAAQAAAIAAAATDALNKANAAVLQSQPHQVAWASTALPALPNSALYPAGYYALTSDHLTYQVNPAGTAWGQVFVGATGIFGLLVAGQITVANYDDLIPNPSSAPLAPNGAPWPAGSWESVGLNPAGYRIFTGGGGGLYLTPLIPCNPGDVYSFQLKAQNWDISGQQFQQYFIFFDINRVPLSAPSQTNTCVDGQITPFSYMYTVPANAFYVQLAVNSTPAGRIVLTGLYARRCSDATVIVDGTITALFARFGNFLASTNNNHAFVSNAVAPIGIYMSGQTFLTYFLDGTSDPNCVLELGGTVNIAGAKAAVVSSKINSPNSTFLSTPGGSTYTSTNGSGGYCMYGSGYQFTPKFANPLVLVLATATVVFPVGGTGTRVLNAALKYGTGTPPAKWAARAGTAIGGGAATSVLANAANLQGSQIVFQTTLPLSAVQAYWFDLELAPGDTTGVILTQVAITVVEL